MDLPFEIALLRSIIKHRPVGFNAHFNMIAVCRSLSQESGFNLDNVEPVWTALKDLYELDEMTEMDVTAVSEDANFLFKSTSTNSESSTQHHNFTLAPLQTADETFDELVAQRPYRESVSPSHAGNTPEPRHRETESPLTEDGVSSSPERPLAKRSRRRDPSPEPDDELEEDEENTEQADQDDEASEEEVKPSRSRRQPAGPAAKKRKSDPIASTSREAGPKLSGAAATAARKKQEREEREREAERQAENVGVEISPPERSSSKRRRR